MCGITLKAICTGKRFGSGLWKLSMAAVCLPSSSIAERPAPDTD
jgi:hypothetical protein